MFQMMDVHSGYRQAGVSAAASVYMQNPIQSNNTGLLTSRQPSPNVMVNPAQQHGELDRTLISTTKLQSATTLNC